jgi:hypothetical protein
MLPGGKGGIRPEAGIPRRRRREAGRVTIAVTIPEIVLSLACLDPG